MNPWDCRGHNLVNAVGLLLCFITTLQYLALSVVYLIYYRKSSNPAFFSMTAVFALCGFVYGMNFVAVFYPNLAYSIQFILQLVLMPACTWLYLKTQLLFVSKNIHESAYCVRNTASEVTAAIASLNASEQRVIAIADQLKMQSHYVREHPWPAWLKSEDSVMLFLNTAYEQWFSVEASAYVGRSDEAVWPPDVAEVFREHDRVVKLSREGMVFSETVSVQNSEVPLLVIKWPAALADGSTGVGGMAIPVNALQQMIQKIQHE